MPRWPSRLAPSVMPTSARSRPTHAVLVSKVDLRSKFSVIIYQRFELNFLDVLLDIIGRAVKILVEVIGNQLEKLQETALKCKSLTKMTQTQIKFFEAAHKAQVLADPWLLLSAITNLIALQLKSIDLLSNTVDSSLIDNWRSKVDDLMRDDHKRFKTFQQQLDELAPAIHQLHKRYVSEHQVEISITRKGWLG